MKVLPPAAVKHYYDRFGALQDRQGFYEDPALDDLFAHSDFPSASSILELGCGTGRFAERVLRAAPAARYTGCDVSTTMIRLARERLAPFGARAEVRLQEPGEVTLPAEDHGTDLIISAYVLDLLPEEGIDAFLGEARRALVPGGRVCLVSIAPGLGLLSRMVMSGWSLVWRLRPGLVGGCRPLELRRRVEGARWAVTHGGRVVSWGITSEIVVAAPG